MCVYVCVCPPAWLYLGSARGVTGVGEEEPLVDKAVLHFVVDQAEVELEGANESVRDELLGVENLHFSETVKHLIRSLAKVEEQNLH